jgi:hypothetical protein
MGSLEQIAEHGKKTLLHTVPEEWWNTVRTTSDSCARIKDLGFIASIHIKMYGERFEIISDPFDEGDGVAVRATCGNDPAIRILRLPIAILVGLADRFVKRPFLAPELTTLLVTKVP